MIFLLACRLTNQRKMFQRSTIIKSALVLIAFLVNIIFPKSISLDHNLLFLIFFPLAVGFLLILSQAYSGRGIIPTAAKPFYMPKWSEPVLDLKQAPNIFNHWPMWQFLMVVLFALGAGTVLGTYLKYDAFHVFAFGGITAGIGGFLGFIVSDYIRFQKQSKKARRKS